MNGGMSPRRLTLLGLGLVGVLLLTNGLWLVPHEGEARHTYERSEITIDDGLLTYEGQRLLEFAEANALVEVGCEPPDDEQPRACAFDAHLVDHPPVSLPNVYAGLIGPEFVEIDDAYYRRVHRTESANGTDVVVHDVDRVSPGTVLGETAVNLTGVSGSSDDLPLEFRVAASGDTVRKFTDLEADELGRIYRLDDSFYTVVRTDRRVIDHGLGFLRYEVPRYLLASIGLVLCVAVAIEGLAGRRTDPG